MPSLSTKTVLSFLLSVLLLTPVAAHSQFKSFRIPTNNSQPEGITLGPDGHMWFAEAAANQIGRIDPKGKITDSCGGQLCFFFGLPRTCNQREYLLTHGLKITDITPE